MMTMKFRFLGIALISFLSMPSSGCRRSAALPASTPAAAAFQLVRGYGRSLMLVSFFGGLSGLGGFVIAYRTNLNTGAIIVIFASLVTACTSVYRHFARKSG